MLAYLPDRLSRKYANQILLMEEFARQEVETLFMKAPQGDKRRRPISRRRQVEVRLARMAAVRPPRGLPRMLRAGSIR